MRQFKIMRNIWLGIENLLLHKLRSFLTMLGIVFGVGSVVAMLSVGEGASKEAMERIRRLGSNNIIITSVKSLDDEKAAGNKFSRQLTYGITYDDYDRILESFSRVKQIVPAKLIRKEARLGKRTLELRIVGTNEKWFDLVSRQVIAGRVFNADDVKDGTSPIVVLTEYGARKLLAAEHTIGQKIRIGSNIFEIVGIVKSHADNTQASQMQTPDSRVDAYIPLGLAKEYYGDVSLRVSSGSFSMEKVDLHKLIVQVKTIEDVEPTAKGIETMLARFHKGKDYEMSVPLELLRQAQETKRTFNIVLGSIASISLLVGGIGIMNIMLASVTERTREIGIRRAIGAKRRQIVTQFLIETVVLSTIGGIIGVVVGVAIPAAITYFLDMPTVVTASGILMPLIISFVVGVIFGLYPAIRAAAVDPIVALRHE